MNREWFGKKDKDNLGCDCADKSQYVFSVIIPCYNEQDAIAATVSNIKEILGAEEGYELIIVDDGSTDRTAAIIAEMMATDNFLHLITHAKNLGYGAALKSGIRVASADLIVITDADGTYPNERLPDLLKRIKDADMVVGSRTGDDVTYPMIRKIPKFLLVRYASWLSNRHIPDLNSGMRVFRKSVAERFFSILPDGFSFTTTITLAMLTNHYQVIYHPVGYFPRIGKSKIRPVRDTLNFVQLIIRTGMYFAPIRVFAPLVLFLVSAFSVSLVYDIFWLNNLTDKTVILLMFSLNAAMFMLLADMIDKRL